MEYDSYSFGISPLNILGHLMMSQPAESKSGFYNPDVQDSTDEELQKFLIYFLDEKEPHIKAEKLLIFTRSYLPASSQQASCKTRSDFFCNLITQIPAVLNMLGISNIGNAESLKEVKLPNDKNILNLQRAGLCLETLCLCLENSHTSQELHSSLKITLTALLQAYNHCKESEQIYGNLLEDFTQHLGYFFKKIEDLQTAMLLILDDSNKMAYSDEDIHSVCSIAHDIEKLCILVSNLDQLMSTKLWKIFIKYVLKYRECLQPIIDVSPVLIFLSSEIINAVKMYKFNLSKVDNEVEELEDVKICSFQLNAIKKIYEVFKGITSDNVNCFRIMIIELYHLFILCYLPDAVEGKYLECVKNVLLKNVQPLTALLFTDSLFMTSVLQINTEAFESEYQLAVILLKLVSMDFLQSPVDISEISPEYLFMNFFSVLEENKPVDDLLFLSIRIPHSLFSRNEDLRFSTLYEIAYAHLSTYLKCISDSQFLSLKDIIKKHLTSDIPTVSLLISDTVMYRLRCSSTEYLCTYCISFAENWSQIDTSINMQIFLKRMFKFLPSHEKKKVFGKISGTLQILEMDSHKLQHRYGIPELTQCAPENLFDQNEQICLLMRHTQEPFPDDIQSRNEKYCKLLELCTLFVNIAQCAVLRKFIEFASHMFKSEVFEVQMAVLTFVKAWKRKNISSAEPQFEETLKSFAMLVAETLCCKNYIVQNEAVSTCVTLFKFNPQIRIMKETLRIPFATVLKSHIAAIPLNSFLSEKEQNKNFQMQLSLFKDLLNASSKS